LKHFPDISNEAAELNFISTKILDIFSLLLMGKVSAGQGDSEKLKAFECLPSIFQVSAQASTPRHHQKPI
jgi:hypothetical protein